MYSKISRQVMIGTLATTLLFSLVVPVRAQSLDGENPAMPAADSPASTETVTEATISLDVTELPIIAAGDKGNEQETEKKVPGDTDVNQEVEEKQAVFLPLVASQNANVAIADAATATAYWRTIEYESFEGIWPGYGWRTYDCNGNAYGVQYWDDERYKPYSGNWSGWPAGGGVNGRNPQDYYYPNNVCTWMIYGPFSLQRRFGNLSSFEGQPTLQIASHTDGTLVTQPATQYLWSAKLSFKYWNQSERNYDYFGWYVSCNGINFVGYRTSGNSAGWRSEDLNLSRCLGDSTVWIGFKFTSDGSIVDDGPFVDDILLQEYR